MDPPPFEACAAVPGATPPPGVPGEAWLPSRRQPVKTWRRSRREEACRCRCGARRAIYAPGQGVPPPPGDSRRHRHRCRGVPPPAHRLSAHFQATARPTSAAVACRHPVRHCRQPGTAWRSRCPAKRAAAAVGRGVPSMPRGPAAVPGVRFRARRGIAATRPCRACRCSRCRAALATVARPAHAGCTRANNGTRACQPGGQRVS